MKKVLFLALAAASFSFTSCDSKTENAQEDAADRVEASGEATEEKMEAAGNEAGGEMAEDKAEATADTMRAAADAQDAK